jgi:hypothetical protein
MYLVLLAALVVLFLRYLGNPYAPSHTPAEFWRLSRLRPSNSTSIHALNNISVAVDGLWAPRIVHQTWKSHTLPPHQTLRWRAACQQLNPDYEFKMFDDDDLKKFTDKYYPELSGMLDALSGVCKYIFYYCSWLLLLFLF